MNQTSAKHALCSLRSAEAELLLEKQSKELDQAKLKIREAIFYIEYALKLENIYE